MSSNYTAGVPIKKRRFPLIRPPSPTFEEQSLLPMANESLQKENSSASEGSVLSSASVPASSSALSDSNKDSLPEEIKGNSDAMTIKMVHSNAGSSRVKSEESSLTMQPLSMAGACNIKKLVPTEKSANTTTISAKTELNLSSGEPSALSIGKHVSSKQKLERKSKSELSITSEITELSLGIKGHHLSGMPGQNGERSQNQERGETILLSSSSSQVESSNQCRSNDFELNIEDANRPTNRSNWDLNTTMDAWDDIMADEALVEVAMGGFNTIGGTNDVKPLISSIGMVRDGVTLEGQIHKENESRSNCAIQPELSSWNCYSNDNLHLALSSSVSSSNANQKPSSSSASNFNQNPLNSLASIDNRKHSSSLASTVNHNASRLLASTVNQKPSNSQASNINQKPRSFLLNPSSNTTNLSVCKTFVLTGNLDKVNIRTIKPEPLDERIKNDFKGAAATPKELLDFGAVKSELVETCQFEALKSSTFSSLKLVDPRSVKSGPVHEGIQETLNKIEGTVNCSGKMMLPDQDIRGKTTRSVNLSTSGDVLNGFQNSLGSESSRLSGDMPQEKSESAKPITSNTMSASIGHTKSTSVGHDGDEVTFAGILDTVIAEDKNLDDPEQPRLKVGDLAPPDSEGNGEGSATDDEKINLSCDMLEDDSYGTDYESDGNHDLGTAMDVEEDGMGEEDFEDGEVREPLADTTIEEPLCEKRESLPFHNGDSDGEQMNFVGLPSGDHPTLSYADNKDNKTEELSEPNNNNIKKSDETTYVEKADKVADDEDAILQEPSAVELPTSGASNCPKGKKIEQLFDEALGASQGKLETVVQGLDGDVRNTDVVDKNIPALPKADVSFNVDDTAKDNNRGGHKSRIINLQASISSSSGRTMTIPDRSLPSRAVRLPDVALEGYELCSRGREQNYTDGSHKFFSGRHQVHSSRNPRLNFGRGRGRIPRRIDTLSGDWDPELDDVPEFYNGPVEFCGPRHKYGLETDFEFSSYNVGTNGALAGTTRGRRKPLNDESPVFHYQPSRRRSPGGREGPPGRGHEMVRRIPRNISPSRCIGEDGSALVGSRHGDKFMRGLLRIHLKSPIGSRRRSLDGFDGHPELPNRRSPIYGMERIRSSDHSCFPEEMVVRRHGSPYLSRQSNDLRDVDSIRDLGHPSPTNRSPSGRVLFRNSRRFDMIDPRERTDNDDYFSRPIHSGRYQEIAVDGPSDERRSITERRGPVRPFRPPYNGAEGRNFLLNAENGPRPYYRFCPENDSEFHDGYNLREREFDRRIKNCPRNAPRRTRNIEEQKGNYGHGGPVWHDNVFDDIGEVKRRRF